MREKIQEAVSEYMKLQHKKHEEQTSLTRFNSTCDNTSSLPRHLALNLSAKVRLPVDSDPNFFKDEKAALEALEQEVNKKLRDIISQARQRHITHLSQRLELSHFISQQVKAFGSFADEIAKIAQERIQSPPNVTISFPKQKLTDHFQTMITSEITKAIAAVVLQQQQDNTNREQQRQAEAKAKDAAMDGIRTGETIKNIARAQAQQVTAPLSNNQAKAKHDLHLVKQRVSNLETAVAARSSASATSSSSTSRSTNKRKGNTRWNNNGYDNNDESKEENGTDEEPASPTPGPSHNRGRFHKRGKHNHPAQRRFQQGGQQLMNQSYQLAAPIHHLPTAKQTPQLARRQQ